MQNFLFQHLLQPALFGLPPEIAHNATILATRLGLAGGKGVLNNPRLRQELWGLTFPNPIGLAAGFDKHGECVSPLFNMGFGAVELGSVTPLPQPGNPRPRVFRDIAAGAIINRYGFPSVGVEKFVRRVRRVRAFTPLPGILGINLGKNKNQEDPIADYLTGMRATHKIADYWVINVSSPNTPGLRSLQERGTLTELMAAAQSLQNEIAPHVPLLLKIAPDLSDELLADIVSVAMARNLQGLVVSNTTITRPAGINTEFAAEAGGLSGKPLMNLSTRMLREVRRATDGKIPLIGVGGIDSAETAYAKIRAGASLVQLYSGLVYAGPGLIPQMFQGLLDLMARDGFANISEAVGQA
ncbi:MAG TPA: quinone-dependent dihydroorotate dehydrogenase [Alphaproteobacteria bacterium]|nr:quinone-dependent dihydroorotate dehydrogenase [Alphaproteobacteria bacterium]